MVNRREGIGLFVRYAFASLISAVLLGAGVEAYTRHEAHRRAEAEAVGEAALLADGVVEPLLGLGGSDGAVLTGQAEAALVHATARLVQSGAIGELRLWSTQGRMLFDARNPAAVDQETPADAAFGSAVGGQSVLARTAPPSGHQVTVLHPLRPDAGADVVAVAELSVFFDQASYQQDQQQLRIALMSVVSVLWVLLALLTHSLTKALRRSDREHRQMALFDQLTGLPNLRCFTEESNRRVAQLALRSEPAAVVLVDLVGFTQINSAVGRAHGDALLRDISARLSAVAQADQLVARVGGDVFVFLLPGVDAEAALEQLACIRNVVGTEVEVAGIPISFEASIGVACFPADGQDIATVLQRADIAMETAKSTHADVVVYRAELDVSDPSRLGLAVELRRAIEKDELFLLYQPKAHLHDESVRGAEALVRWNHPERGLISPAEFIPVAEATGLIVPLTAWVLDTAIDQAARWAASGLRLRVAINVSAKNLRDERFPEQLLRQLALRQLPAELFEVEITETAIITDPERAARSVRRLREAGVAVALDDFGQGATSLAHLRNLALSTLKIDKCFVDGVCYDNTDASIVRATIELGHQLGLEVVAEGVEDGEQYVTLAGWGCDVAQGFYFARPMSAADISARFGPGSATFVQAMEVPSRAPMA